MMRFVSPLLVLTLLACATPTEVPAQAIPCAEAEETRTKLGHKYHEARRGWGISNSGNLIELFSTEEKARSWTILKQTPGNVNVCVLDVGDGGVIYPLANNMDQDEDGYAVVWRGFANGPMIGISVYEFFVNETDMTWKVKRTTRAGEIRIMAEGVMWVESNENLGRGI